MKALGAARLPATADVVQALDHCLGCRACEAVCPAKVEYGALLVDSRAALRPLVPRSWRERVLELMVRRPRLLSALLGLARPWQRLLPIRLAHRWPRIPTPFRSPKLRAATVARGRVGLFLGCVARRMDAPVHRAASVVLARLGWDVVVPARQGCCGSLHAHAGGADAAAAMARDLAQAFVDARVDVVLVSASGCHEAVATALRPHGVRVEALCAFLADDPRLRDIPLRPLTERVVLHTPCTQRNVIGDAQSAAALLRRIPGLTVAPIRHAACCGAAGSHMLRHPERAAALRAPLLAEVAALAPDRLCTSNIGCRLHLHAGLADAAAPPRLQHPVELIAEQWP